MRRAPFEPACLHMKSARRRIDELVNARRVPRKRKENTEPAEREDGEGAEKREMIH